MWARCRRTSRTITVYAAGVGAAASDAEAAKALLIKMLAGPQAAGVLSAKGMQRPGS